MVFAWDSLSELWVGMHKSPQHSWLNDSQDKQLNPVHVCCPQLQCQAPAMYWLACVYCLQYSTMPARNALAAIYKTLGTE